MILSKAISKISYAIRGLDDIAPLPGTEEYEYWVSVLNDKKDELYEDVSKLWSNTFAIRTLAETVSAGSNSFVLPDDFLAPSDTLQIISNGKTYDISVVKPEERNDSTELAAYISQEPAILTFTQPIRTESNLVGGEIQVSGYYLPSDISDDDDKLPFPSSQWAIFAAAAEIAFNDIVYETKAPDLNSKANALYKTMLRRNFRGTHRNPRRTGYAVPIIGDRT